MRQSVLARLRQSVWASMRLSVCNTGWPEATINVGAGGWQGTSNPSVKCAVCFCTMWSKVSWTVLTVERGCLCFHQIPSLRTIADANFWNYQKYYQKSFFSNYWQIIDIDLRLLEINGDFKSLSILLLLSKKYQGKITCRWPLVVDQLTGSEKLNWSIENGFHHGATSI